MIGAPIFYPSSPIEIRDGTYDRVLTVPGLKNVYRARTAPTQDDQMPLACVWYARERTAPNGDDNVSSPKFVHTLTLVIDVMVRAATDPALDATVTTLVETIRATLVTDPTWVQLFEGIGKIDTAYSYPKEAADIVVQAMIEIEVTFRSEWPPFVPDELDTIDVIVEPREATATCGTCQWPNANGAASCTMCGAPLPVTAFTLEFDLRDPPPC